MGESAKPPALVRALKALAPDAEITVLAEVPWYSLTFAGKQLSLSVRLSGDRAMEQLHAFAGLLPEYEFALPALLVADIVAEDIRPLADGAEMSVLALVLDE